MFRHRNKRAGIILILVLLSSCLGQGPMRERVLEEAATMGNALVQKDYEAFIRYVPNWAIRPARSRKDWKKNLEHLVREKELKGYYYTAAHYELISQIEEKNGIYQCILSQHITISTKYQSTLEESFVLATSNDAERWQFATITYMSRKDILAVFPDFHEKLSLPGWAD